MPAFRTRKIASIVLLTLLCSFAFSFPSGCGNGEQGDGRGVSDFSGETVRRLDGAIAEQRREEDLPGVAIGVWVPGEGRYVVARGKANLKSGEKRDLHDPFRIGSITRLSWPRPSCNWSRKAGSPRPTNWPKMVSGLPQRR